MPAGSDIPAQLVEEGPCPVLGPFDRGNPVRCPHWWEPHLWERGCMYCPACATTLRPESDRALTLRQPWAWLVICGPKNIENRRWNTRFRGRVYIHTSKVHSRQDYDAAALVCGEMGVELPPYGNSAYQLGGIIGSVDIVDVLPRGDASARWKFSEQYGFVLEAPRQAPFVPCKGALSFWKVPGEVLAQLCPRGATG